MVAICEWSLGQVSLAKPGLQPCVVDSVRVMHVLRKRTRNACVDAFTLRKVYGKLLGTDRNVAERARWLTWTRIPGSIWPIVSLL